MDSSEEVHGPVIGCGRQWRGVYSCSHRLWMRVSGSEPHGSTRVKVGSGPHARCSIKCQGRWLVVPVALGCTRARERSSGRRAESWASRSSIGWPPRAGRERGSSKIPSCGFPRWSGVKRRAGLARVNDKWFREMVGAKNTP